MSIGMKRSEVFDFDKKKEIKKIYPDDVIYLLAQFWEKRRKWYAGEAIEGELFDAKIELYRALTEFFGAIEDDPHQEWYKQEGGLFKEWDIK